MTDDPITRLNAALDGRYLVERELGEGGMATVYLAQDLKHQRSVALKVLKPELAAVVGAERFLAEIQVTANLQHPHILPLHDSGEADGFLYYVMPYVEEETLRDRLDRERQLPVDEALKIVTDLAEALDYAHRREVIHRDVKPANILMHEGRPLMADFGIALAVGSAGGARLTETGLSLGTPYYMSPEQATGDVNVGAQSDTYALACVLFEMLVGEPPYPGATAQAVLGKIIQGKPVSATEFRSTIPPNVDAAIRCALERLPADRFATAKEFASALVDPGFRHGIGDEAVAARPPGPWPAISVVALGIATVSVAAALWSMSRPERLRPVERFELPQPASVAWLTSPSLTVSPDGSTLVFQGVNESSVDQIYVRTLDNLDARPLQGTEGGHHPVVSPDGQEVAFFAMGRLNVTSLAGGLVRPIAEEATCCASWEDDGYLYFTAEGAIQRVAASGGAVETVMERPEDGPAFFFHPIPGSRKAVVTIYAATPRLESFDWESGERQALMPGVNGIPTPSGHLVAASPEGQILAAPFDLRSGQLQGPAIPMLEDVWVSTGLEAFFALSDAGTLLYWSGGLTMDELEFVWVNRSGQATQVDADWTFRPGADNRAWDLSPDGSRIALKAVTDLGRDIWVKALPDGPLSRLTFADGENRFPRWSPDGESVAFLSNRDGNLDVWTKRADGTGEAELLLDVESSLAEAFWSPDGEWLIVRSGGTAGVIGGRDILGFRPGVDDEAVPLITSEFDEAAPTLSPDGRWLAYHSDETGRREVFIRPFPEVDRGKWQVSDQGGRQAVWGPDGRELFYVSGGAGNLGARDVIVAEIDPGPPFAVVGRRTLFPLPQGYYFANNSRSYQLAPDGERFLMARLVNTGEENPSKLILVQNWFTELEARVGR
jgi:serine/threonine-protein kinase